MFFHADGERRRWVSYSTTKDTLFCVPCLFFNDGLRTQSNNFTSISFSNWIKQYDGIAKHETSEAHLNAKIAEVLFLQNKTVESFFKRKAGKREYDKKTRSS